MKLVDKIAGFGTLREGWYDGTKGKPFDDTVLREAQRLTQSLTRRKEVRVDAFPGFDGEVLVTFDQGNLELEVYLHPGGAGELVHNVDGREIYRARLSWESLPDTVQELLEG